MSSPHFWTASDGARLAWHEMGEGRPVLLLHGLASNATVNWIKYGHAERIAATGRRVIMPDLRCHGDSEAPTDPARYVDGILARDLEELVGHLGLAPGGYDLGGFSLGARTTVHAVGEGLRPARALLCGMGLEGLTGWERRQSFFLAALDRFDTARRGDPDFMAIAFMKTMRVVPEAMRLLLPTFTDAKDEWLEAFTMPSAVVCGSEDRDNGDPAALAAALPAAEWIEVPGTHMSSVTKPELGEAMAGFLGTA